MMSDTADDLLNELSHLQDANDEMDQQVASASSKKETLQKDTQKATSVDAITVALEAAKTAHMAAEQSQHAADKAINLAHEQKAQIVELSDANIAWRQSLRSASKDIRAARNAVSIMMSVSITVSVVSAGAIGWLLYSLNNQYEQLKGNVLDIITTENTLFTKNLTLKVDQLSSLIEALASDVQRLAQQAAPVKSTMLPPIAQEAASQTAAKELLDPTKEPPMEMTGDEKDTPAMPSSAMMAAVDHSEQLTQIETLIQKIIAEQQKLQANALAQIAQLEKLDQKLNAPENTSTAKTPVQTNSSGLNQTQLNQLNAIAASASEQQKLLKAIMATLKSQRAPTSPAAKTTPLDLWPKQESAFKKLSDQIDALQQKQDALVVKMESLEALNKEVLSQPKPYSYRSPELPIQAIESTPE